MYTLYYSPGACSMAIHVALNEMGQKVQLEKVVVQQGEGQKPEFLKLNPRGQVPVLVEDGKALREGGAILVYLCEKHKSELLPQSGWERAMALQWLMFANASLHPAYSRVFGLTRATIDAGAKDAMFETSFKQINSMWRDVEAQLANQDYICGSKMTVADILLTVIANWSANFPAIQIGPKTRAMFARVIQRPAYQQAIKDEGVEYKMAS